MKRAEINLELLKGALSQKQTYVAGQIGWQLNTISRKLNGRIGLSLDDLNQICRTIGREPAEFIKFVEENKKAA